MNALETEFPNNKPLYPPVSSPQAARVSGLLRLEVGIIIIIIISINFHNY